MCILCYSHAQSLAAAKAYMAWLSQFYSQAQRDRSPSATHQQNTTHLHYHPQQQQHVASTQPSTSMQQCNAMIASTLDATIPLFTTQQPVCLSYFLYVIISPSLLVPSVI